MEANTNPHEVKDDSLIDHHKEEIALIASLKSKL
jgi:hypothetical protein